MTATVIVVFRDGTSDAHDFPTVQQAVGVAREEAKWETCQTATVTVDGEVVFEVEGDFVP